MESSAHAGWKFDFLSKSPERGQVRAPVRGSAATIWGKWQYCTFKARLSLEQFIDFNGTRAPDDYKFFCFKRKACLIEIDVDRFTQAANGVLY